MKIRVPSQLWGQCGFFFKHSLSLCSLLLAISAYSLEVGYTYSYSSSKSAWSAPGDETTLTSGHCYEDTNHGLWGSWFGVLALEQPHPGPLGWPRREGGEGRRWQELSSFRWFNISSGEDQTRTMGGCAAILSWNQCNKVRLWRPTATPAMRRGLHIQILPDRKIVAKNMRTGDEASVAHVFI